MSPRYLPTITMNELYEQVYTHKPSLIEGLLYTGTYLFVGAPKLGKSFFMAQLAYHVSTGTPLWDYPVRQGTVLYLALEDDFRRLQERLYRMFDTEGTDKLFFSITAHQLGKGLDEQLNGFVGSHPDTSLIIIDTLQKVREMGGDSCSYANDYEVIIKLKHFADSRGICLLLVHHTRKQQADDKFDMISGTNGLLGAADGAFLLHKEKRTSNAAVLLISGRDQQDQKLYLVRDPQKLSWNLDQELFGEAVAEYNARQIQDYYAHIAEGNREEPFYEVIVQFGDCQTAPVGSHRGNIAASMLEEYMMDFEYRNPNLHVFNASLHLDEACPHLHIDFIPFYTKERQRGF